MRERREENREIELSKEEICEAIGVVLKTSDGREKAVEDLTTQLKLVSQMKTKEVKRLGKRSIEAEKTGDRDQGKKKKGIRSKDTESEKEEVREVIMEMETEVSTNKSENNDIGKEVEVDKDKEQESNNLQNAQDTVIEAGRRAKIVRRNGLMIYEDMARKEGEEKDNENTCFKSDHRGEIVVQARVMEKYVSKNKMNNMVKIAREMVREGIKVKEMKQCGLSVAELKFTNIVEANNCMNIGRRDKEEGQIRYSIPGRMQRIKGFISDWDSGVSLHELIEAMEGVIQLERMKRRYIDEKTKESKYKLTELIIITFEGNKLPQSVSLFGGIVRLRVRAFMEPVRQCYGCYEYGHYRHACRYNGRKCMVCGKEFHGECYAEPSCINCGGKHIATDRKRCVM